MLADLGADVKVEAPDGNMMRLRPLLRNGASGSSSFLNAGKRSMVLDLKKSSGVDAVRALAVRADIVVENFRPGVADRLV